MSTNQQPANSITSGQSGWGNAANVAQGPLENAPATLPTSQSGGSLSKPKATSLLGTEPSSLMSAPLTPPLTCDSCLERITGAPKHTSKGIPSGPLSTDSNGQWASAYQSPGSEFYPPEKPEWQKATEDNCRSIAAEMDRLIFAELIAPKGLPVNDAERKALPIWTYLMGYFPDALLAEVGVAVAGNKQHNPGEPLHWDREKSKDQLNTAFRHIWDHGRGVTKDTDGQYHLAKAIWRLKAELQLTIEKDRKDIEDLL